ncbi:MAG: hypothetical protein AAF591_03325 [Verrucomicrobiota bacterium]
MNRYIVTTTIYEPTEATLKYCDIAREKGWVLVVVGDKATPEASYRKLEARYGDCVRYLSVEAQAERFPEVSESLGWGCIQRRNVGFLYAYEAGAEVVATVDDDNVPYDSWGDEVFVGETIDVALYAHRRFGVFDPLSVTSEKALWHRGYPIECVPEKNDVERLERKKRRVLVQADLWDGDPDVDAICRLSLRPEVRFEALEVFGSPQISPFNSQNTFLSREVMSSYAVLPGVGRMDDIWGGYILQHHFPGSVIYHAATVRQDRHDQDLVANLEKELCGYRGTLGLLGDLGNYISHLPAATVRFLEIYQREYCRIGE